MHLAWNCYTTNYNRVTGLVFNPITGLGSRIIQGGTPSSSRMASSSCGKLEQIDSGQMGAGGHGIQTGTLEYPKAAPKATGPGNKNSLMEEEIAVLQAKGAVTQVDGQNPGGNRGFYSTMFLLPKQDGNFRPVFSLRNRNQTSHFKMEGVQTVKDILRLVYKYRPQGHLLCSAHTQRPPEISQLQMAEHQLPVYMPAIWAQNGTQSNHQAPQAGHDLPAEQGSSQCDIYRQYPAHDRDSGESSRQHSHDTRPTGEGILTGGVGTQ